MPLKSATLKKMKLRPRDPGDQNATTLPALVAGEIAIRQAHTRFIFILVEAVLLLRSDAR